MKQQNLDQLAILLDEVSDPKSVKYGQYLSFDQLGDMTRNPTSNKVLSMEIHNIDVVQSTVNGDYLVVEAKIHVWSVFIALNIYLLHKFELF